MLRSCILFCLLCLCLCLCGVVCCFRSLTLDSAVAAAFDSIIRNYNEEADFKCRLMSVFGDMVSTVEKVDTYVKEVQEP